MNDIGLLRLFVMVASTGSFSAVARARNTTPSAVSRQISRLEEDLGTRLLQRTTRQQSLTEAGEVLLRHAKQVIADLDAARLAVSNRNATPTGTLRITAESDLAAILLAPLLPEFMAENPELSVRLFTSASLEDLVERSIDVAIRMGHLESSSLVARRLTMSRSLILASPTYLEQRGNPKRPEELALHTCLSFRTGSDQTLWQFNLEGQTLDVPISARLQAASPLVLRNAANAGLGIAMLPNWIVREELSKGSLVPLLAPFPLVPPATPINAVYPSGRNLAGKVRVFIDFISTRIGRGEQGECSPSALMAQIES